MSYAPCPSCRRHIHEDERSCPFCRATVEWDALKIVPSAKSRMSRASAFVFASAVGVAGCGGSIDTPSPSDSGAKDSSADTAATDTGGIGPVYGAPVDATATADTAPPSPDDGGGVPIYGASPP